MKVGENLNHTEDYIFWRLAHFFISDLEYRVVKLSDNQTELWLEKRENKKAQIIRLLQYDIDWGNWLQQDIEKTVINGEAIRKQITRGELHVCNLYVSAYPPVDDYEFRIEEPYIHPKSKKTIINSVIIDRTSYKEKIQQLSHQFGLILNISDTADEQHWGEVEKLKRESLHTAVTREKSERALFEFGKPFFTYVFIGIQVIMYLILEAFGGSTNTSTLIQFGAKFNPLILEGEWWRFFTPIILHIGFLHLAMNTLALFYLGTAVERIYGRLRFIFIYIAAGFGGSLASFMFSPNLSAGASGAIFGCFGALLYFGMIYPKLFFRTMGLNIFVVLAINLSFGFTVPGIDNAGHIGGLIGGFLATGIVHFPKKKKWGLQAVFLLLTILLSSGILRYGYANPTAVVDETSILVMTQEYIEKENYDEAYRLLVDFSKVEDLSAQYYFLLSYTEIKLDKLGEAEASLLKVIELEPRFHEAHYNLALVYLDKQEYENARKHAEKAVEINPNNDDYQNLLQQF
jgi:rhomboid protease GluP